MKCVRPLVCGLVLCGLASVASAQVYYQPDDGCGSGNPFYYRLDAHSAQLLWALRTPVSEDARRGNGCVVPTRWTNEEFGQLPEACNPLKVGQIDPDEVCYTEPRYFRMDGGADDSNGATTTPTQPKVSAPATTQPSGAKIIIIPKQGWPQAPAASDKLLVIAD